MLRLASRLVRYTFAFCGALEPLAPAAPPAPVSANAVSAEADLDPPSLYAEVLPTYLVNFARYVRWPEPVHAGAGVVRIGIFSSPSSAALVEQGLAGKTIETLPIEVLHSPETDLLRQCRLILLDRPSRATVTRIQEALKSSPALVVSYRPEAGANPTGIELVVKGGELRFRLSTQRLALAGLSPSPDLLRLALPPPIMQIKMRPVKATPTPAAPSAP